MGQTGPLKAWLTFNDEFRAGTSLWVSTPADNIDLIHLTAFRDLRGLGPVQHRALGLLVSV